MGGPPSFPSRLSLIAFIFFLSAGLCTAQGQVQPKKPDLAEDYIRLRAANAVLKARLSLSKETVPYLVLDLPARELHLELQGVTLTRVPVRQLKLNQLAEGISVDTTRIAFSMVPFVLQEDRWFEDVPTMAFKDSAAVMSRPDTTGALVERIRKTPVLAMLHYERNLAVVLNGFIPIESRKERWKARIKGWFRSRKAGTPEWYVRKERDQSILMVLDLEPAQVRTLAPNVTEGTKLILSF